MLRLLLVAVGTAILAGCAQPQEQPRLSNGDDPPRAATTIRVERAGDVATDLAVPWAMAALPDGSVLVTHRDSAEVTRLHRGGTETVGRVADVVPGGEGGLLGIAVPNGVRTGRVWVYYTAESDNRIAVLDWDGRRLTGQRAVFTGIPKSQIHDGGRIAFGPDGMLYVATGDAADPDSAQDPASFGGKILRITGSGRPAPDNPQRDSPVYSIGHRNVQGLAWDEGGRLWATEFGQNDADELNLVRPGGNYGWPECEGGCDRPGFTDPQVVWSPTAIASPSGMAIAAGSAWVASLRGETLWQVPLTGGSAGEPVPWLRDELGRLRDVIVGPEGGLWLATSNTDGRGEARPGDDRIVRLALREP